MAKGQKSIEGSKLQGLLKDGSKQSFYTSVKPMLATLVDKPFDADSWVYEVKWDGYRAIAFKKDDILELKSRNNKSFIEKFYPISKALAEWNVNAIVDGEIIVVDENGSANFSALQNWRSEADGELIYYVFDILWYDGIDVKGIVLTKRKEILNSIIPQKSVIRISNDFQTSGIEFLEIARKMGLEGIMAKRKSSIYQPGNRTKDWLKIKANLRQEVVIGGYTLNEGSRKPFSSLLVGVYDKGKLVYTGHIGTGFSTKTQREMLGQFKPLIIDKSPFNENPDVNKPSRFRPNPPNATATWLKPELVCEVSFTEMTNDGVMRHPSFKGMRTDKEAKEVVLETKKNTKEVLSDEPIIVTKQVKGKVHKEQLEQSENKLADMILKPVGKLKRRTLLNPTEKTQVKKVGGHELKFTNLQKLYWPDKKIAKRDLINYYYRAAPFILPYTTGRPMTLKRYPEGIKGFSFYQKNVKGKVPVWVKTYLYYSEADEEEKLYMLVNDEPTLMLMANMGSIELHPWSSTEKKPDHPTWCIIDLDPANNSFDQVIDAARVTKDVLDSMDIKSYVKTSGSTGLHIYIPLGSKYTYEQSKEFARVVVTLVHNEIPKFTSIERLTSNREGKMYLDFLQNRPHATVAAPYSLRPKPEATVSMPLFWDEVKKGLKISDFTILNAIERMESVGDIFKPVIGKGVDLIKVIKD
jgi:bifunctional non-homologous end joining protein LigD